jgi:recombination protein RecA
MDIQTAIAKINKNYGENTIGFAKDLKYSDVQRIPTGSLFLNWALGKNPKNDEAGWPMGRVAELYGPESSGKSLISMKTIAEAQKKGYECLYLDCENTFDRSFATTLGVDVDKLVISRESQGEVLMNMVCDLMKQSDKLKVIVFDSLASMIPHMEMDDPIEKNQMAPVARMMSRGLRKLTACNKNGALIIFINQLRTNPGTTYGNPEYTPGGNSLKYYASLRLEVRRGDWIFDVEDKKKKLGQVVKFKVVKNKTDVPYKEGYFKFLYTGEIDKVDELLSIGLLNGTITRHGAYYELAENKWQGREEMEKALKEDANFFEECREFIFKK